MNEERLLKALRNDEGFRSKPYRDTLGNLTVGYGWNLSNGIRREEARLRLKNDMWEAYHRVSLAVKCFQELDEARQEVLVNMAFNIGLAGLLEFRKMLAALEAGDYEQAAEEMLDSRWAEQVGRRAPRLARQMRTGEA